MLRPQRSAAGYKSARREVAVMLQSRRELMRLLPSPCPPPLSTHMKPRNQGLHKNDAQPFTTCCCFTKKPRAAWNKVFCTFTWLDCLLRRGLLCKCPHSTHAKYWFLLYNEGFRKWQCFWLLATNLLRVLIKTAADVQVWKSLERGPSLWTSPSPSMQRLCMANRTPEREHAPRKFILRTSTKNRKHECIYLGDFLDGFSSPARFSSWNSRSVHVNCFA